MPKKAAAQISATRPLRRAMACCGVRAVLGPLGGALGVRVDIAAQPHQGDHEDQDDEGRETQADGDVAAIARLLGGPLLGVPVDQPIHFRSSSAWTPVTASPSRAANRANR